jgi:hypothetical protein
LESHESLESNAAAVRAAAAEACTQAILKATVAAMGKGIGGDSGGVLELMLMFRDQWAAGGGLVGRESLFGSGSKTVGAFGGVPMVIAWYGFKRFVSFVSAAPVVVASKRPTLTPARQESVDGRTC